MSARSSLVLRFGAAALVALSSLSLCTSAVSQSSSTYYVSPGGNDNSDGRSPGTAWLTVAKVNDSTFAPGDTILFQRGGQWHESLIAPSSGAAGQPITFASYGDGAKPKFWGSVVLDNTQFQSIGNGLYTYAIAQPVYSVLANQAFFNYSFGQYAGTVAGSWSYDGGQITIDSPASDPRYDGRLYTAVLRDDVVYSNHQSHLVFNNLVVDESARYDDNGGYGFRVMGSQDVQLFNCEAYHAGKHNFGVINSTGFVGTGLVAAYAAPGQNSTGGASAYVSYGDSSTGLANQTSEWHNVSASNMDDAQENSTYYAFITHGSNIGSLLVDHLQSAGANVSLSNEDAPTANEKITGGLIQNARLELEGTGLVVDGMELSGPLASVDVVGDNMTLQNMLIHGTSMGSAWYQTALLSRGNNNVLRFSTIDMAPNAGSNSCVASTNNSGGLQLYGNAFTGPQRSFVLWAEGLSSSTVAVSSYNFYTPGNTFASYVGGPFQFVDIPFAQWQSYGFDQTSTFGDPKYSNGSTGNYTPNQGSPLIDAAYLPTSLLSVVPLDFAGNARLQGATFDIGALESTGAVVPVAKQNTAITLSLSNNILYSQVSAGSGTPTGSVNFLDGGTLLSTVPLNGVSASLGVSLDSTLAHTLTAVYSGDANNNGSTSSAITVNPVPVAPVSTYPLALTYPVNGQTVSGIIMVTAIIPEPLDAAGSQLLIDGQPPNDHRTTQPPYAYTLDTTQLSPGTHQLQIWAHDISNENLLSNPISIVVVH